MTRIFCVEDDTSIRELIVYMLNASGFSAVGFENADSFFSELNKEIPGMAILDLMLPDTDGMEILRILRSQEATKKLPVILLTAKSDRLDKIKGLDSGADDYITKPFDVLELVSRIKAVLRRSDGSESEKNLNLTCGFIKIDVSSHKVFAGEKEIHLTYKEYELLCLLIKNKNIVLSRDTLMNKVWGVSFEGETRTVDVHIRTLRQKLEKHGSIIETVRNVGYRVTDNV